MAKHYLHTETCDEKGHGGAHHDYKIMHGDECVGTVKFQNGPIKEHGVNGVTHEALLAILIHRMECFQAGEYANEYNAGCLHYLQGALAALEARTAEREQRGVEGTHQK